MKLTLKQTKALDFLEDNQVNEVFFGGAAGGGKSAIGCYWQLKNRIKYPGTRGGIGRKNLKDIKETTLKTLFEVAKMQGLVNGVHFKYKEQKSTILFSNSSEIVLKELKYIPSDRDFDRFGSLELTDFFIDETPQIMKKAKDAIKSRIRFKIDDYDLIPKLLMTGNPTKNWIYKNYYIKQRENELADNIKFIQSLAKDNPHISKHYIENLKGLETAMVQRLLYGNWEYDDDPTSLIDYDNIISIFKNDHLDLGNEKYITADIARLGSDKAIILVWDGFVIIDYHVIEKDKVTAIQSKITEFRNKYKIPKINCIADEDGVGGGVVDNLGIKGFTNNAKAFNNENYENLKAQCTYKLAEMINKFQIYFKAELSSKYMDEITEELECVKTYKIDDDKKLKVLPKDKIKEIIGRSPDWLDSLFMRMYFEYKPKFIGNFTTL